MFQTVILDMDGVLVDFVGSILKAHGIETPQEVFYENCRGRWDIDTILKMSPDEFWKPVDRAFWANLQPTKDCYEILGACEDKVGKDNVYLWTTPCECDGCYDGKRDWLKKHFHNRYQMRQLIAGPAKFIGASRFKVLVDDSDSNIEKFAKVGGHTILVPRLWNKDNALSTEALYHVKERLKLLTW